MTTLEKQIIEMRKQGISYRAIQKELHVSFTTISEVEKAYIQAHREFYFRPKYVIKKILGIRSFNQVKIMLRGLTAILKINSQK